MKKIAFLLALILICSTFLVACNTGASTASTTAATTKAATTTAAGGASEPQKEVTLRVIWWGSQTRADNTQAALAVFTEKYPWIKTESEFSAWDGYWERLAAMIAGNNLSDVFQQDYQYLQQYADNGIMLNLNPYINNGLDTANIEENTLNGGAVDGNLFAVSLGLNSQCIVWDPELFDKAGVAYPPERWSWDEYIKTATELHDKLGIYGDEYFPSSYYHGLNLWLRQHGYSVYADDGNGLGYTDDELFASYYQMDYDLIKAGVTAPPDIRDEISSTEDQLIVTQRAAMFGASGGSNQLAAQVNAAGRPLKLTSLPYLEGEKSGQFLKPSQFFCVYSGSKNPDEAVKLVDFVTNDVDANMELKGERGVPISSVIREALSPTMDETQQEIFRYIDSVSTFAHQIGKPEPAAHAELDPILKNIRYEILSGQISAIDGAKKFRSEAERVFASLKK